MKSKMIFGWVLAALLAPALVMGQAGGGPGGPGGPGAAGAGGPGGFGGGGFGPGGAGGGFGGPGGGGGGYGPGGFGGGGGGYAIIDYLQQQINSPDREWTVVGPRVQKVIDTRAVVQSGEASPYAIYGGFGGGGGGFGGPGGRGGGGFGGSGDATAENPLSKAFTDLQVILGDGTAKEDVINVRLKAYRDAMTKAKSDNKAAQEDLRRLLTMRQEGILIALGYLD